MSLQARDCTGILERSVLSPKLAAHSQVRTGSQQFCDEPQTQDTRRRLLIGIGALLSGCAGPYAVPGSGGPVTPQRVATLDVEGRVEVLQGGRVVAGRDGMALSRGDEVRTFASTYAQIRFVDGDRVWLDYDTRVRVGSLFTFFGRVFAAVSGVFEVDSEFLAASSEGTEFTVTVGRSGRTDFSVAVRTGSVLCRSPRGTWRTVRLPAGERLVGRGTAVPRADALDSREQQSEFGWVPSFRMPPERVREPAPRREAPPPERTAPPPATSTPPTKSTPPASSPPATSPVVPRPRGGILDRIERPQPPSEPVIR